MMDDRRRNERRAELIDTAVESFRTHGPSGVGISQLCDAVGVTKGVFSHHFPNGKSELIAAVIDQNTREIEQLLSTLLAERSVAEGVRTMFNLYARRLQRDLDYGCPIAASVIDISATDPDVREATGAAFQRWGNVIAAALERGGAEPNIARNAATHILATFEGALIVARATADSSVLETLGASVSAYLETGLPSNGQQT